MKILKSTATIALCFVAISAATCRAESFATNFQTQPLSRIPAGTVVDKEETKGWSDLLLFVKGSLGAGDVNAASSTVRHYAKLFNLVYMANVNKHDDGTFSLDKVGVGFSTNIRGKDVIISADSHKQLGANLGMIGGAVFSANEKALDEIVQIARYRDGLVFDAPTIMLRGNEHRKVLVRFFVWVSPKGEVGTVCWALDGAGASRYQGIDRRVVLLRPRLIENRVMHVDGDAFTFGIPSEDAFAVVDLPPGRTYQIDNELNTMLAAKNYNSQSFFSTIRKLSESLSSAN